MENIRTEGNRLIAQLKVAKIKKDSTTIQAIENRLRELIILSRNLLVEKYKI